MENCPCGSGKIFDECCGPVVGGAPAQTAEALMRSRYSAYALGDFDHLENSLASEIRGQINRSAAESMANGTTWLNLEVRTVTDGGAEDQTGLVEFVARFKDQDGEKIHHELASFRREQGRWVYVEGKINPKPTPRQVTKVGRNEHCSCGSGKKFKKCCGA